MSGGLPIQIDPLDLARNQVQLEGQFAMAKMPRLAAYSPSQEAAVHVKLDFALDGSGLAKLTGYIRARLQLVCERCLHPFELDLVLDPQVYFDTSGVEADETDERDIIPVAGPVDLKGLVEDEILLAMPMIPMHESGKCKAGGLILQDKAEKQQTDNPFAKLAILKKGKQTDEN